MDYDHTDVLKSFKVATNAVSTARPVVRLLWKMTNHLDSHSFVPEVHALLKRLQLKIGNCSEPLLNREVYSLATMCDCRMKRSITIKDAFLSDLKHTLLKRISWSQREGGILRGEEWMSAGPGDEYE